MVRVIAVVVPEPGFAVVVRTPHAFMPMAIAISRAVEIMSETAQWLVAIPVVGVRTVVVEITMVFAPLLVVFLHPFFPLFVIFLRRMVGVTMTILMSGWALVMPAVKMRVAAIVSRKPLTVAWVVAPVFIVVLIMSLIVVSVITLVVLFRRVALLIATCMIYLLVLSV